MGKGRLCIHCALSQCVPVPHGHWCTEGTGQMDLWSGFYSCSYAVDIETVVDR